MSVLVCIVFVEFIPIPTQYTRIHGNTCEYGQIPNVNGGETCNVLGFKSTCIWHVLDMHLYVFSMYLYAFACITPLEHCGFHPHQDSGIDWYVVTAVIRNGSLLLGYVCIVQDWYVFILTE